MSRRLVGLVLLLAIGCGTSTPVEQRSADPTPPLRPASAASHAQWLQEWRAALPATATLHRGEHRGEVAGSFYSRVKVHYPVFAAPITIENRTGHALTTGTDLYLFQTASQPPAKGAGPVLEVIGGQFRETPVEDYAGVIEVRGAKATPEVDLGLGDSIDEDRRRGFFGGFLDVLLSIAGDGGNILDRRHEKTKTFGNAAPGRTLSIDSDDLQMTVHVAKAHPATMHVVSPAIMFGTGPDRAVFRYVFRFDGTAGAAAESTLISIDDASLMPLLNDAGQPMWKRALVTGWAASLTSPESAAVLEQIGADVKQPLPVRQAALLSLGTRRLATEMLKGIATNRKEPSRLRGAAARALRGSPDPAIAAFLITLLKDNDEVMRAQAIDSLLALKARDAAAPLLTLLSKQDDGDLRAIVVNALAVLGDQTTAAGLVAIGKKNAEDRRLVIPAIAKIGGLQALAALGDLSRMSAPRGKEDEDWPVRSDVLDALSGVDDPAALVMLKAGLGDPHDSVRGASIRAIASVRSAERTAIVLPLMDDSREDMVRAAIDALADRQAPEAKPKLLEIVKTPARSKDIRWAAVRALGQYSGADVAAALQAVLDTEPDANIKADALSAIAAQLPAGDRAPIERALRDKESYVASRAARLLRKQAGLAACGATLDALTQRNDGDADGLVNRLTLPGCRDKASFEKVTARLGGGNAEYDAELVRLLESWSGQELGSDKAKWTAWAAENVRQ